MLIDSDVLVWLTRGHPGAARRLRQLSPWRISTVTYIELAQGCRNKAELERLKKGLAQRGAQIMPVTGAISERAMWLIDQHTLSAGLQLGDALIGATALELGLTLITANVKHFGSIPGLGIERFDPAAGVHSDAHLHLPVYLDDQIQNRLTALADAKGVDLSVLVNDLLRKDIELIEMVR